MATRFLLIPWRGYAIIGQIKGRPEIVKSNFTPSGYSSDTKVNEDPPKTIYQFSWGMKRRSFTFSINRKTIKLFMFILNGINLKTLRDEILAYIVRRQDDRRIKNYLRFRWFPLIYLLVDVWFLLIWPFFGIFTIKIVSMEGLPILTI